MTTMSSDLIAQSEPGRCSRERALFDSLRNGADGSIDPKALPRAIQAAGIRLDDPRVAESVVRWRERMDPGPDRGALDLDEFNRIVCPGRLTIERALRGELVIPEFDTFTAELSKLFEQSGCNKDGAVADYIPKLSKADPEQFGLAICTTDGQRKCFGDANVPFTSQCIHKPINYCLALEEHGEEVVHQHMGCEPSGQSFNEISLNKDGLPHNPMLNAGAIMCGALIRQDLDFPDKFDHAADLWQRLAGGVRPGFDNTTYLSERRTADRNFALTYFLSEHDAFPEGTDLIEALEFYIQCCSLEVTTEIVSVVAATLASGGLCPLTGERVLRPDTVQKCLAFMYSCGMYDFSGEWAFKIGLPAKSGVSGGVMVVVPNVMGLCLWSPRLEPHGNSVRAIDFCERLVSRFNFHHYDNVVGGCHDKIDPRLHPHQTDRDLLVDLCWAASEGDLDSVRRLVVRGADLDAADYDGRTAMHLAASEGREELVAFLLEFGAKSDPIDRWGGRPVDDAKRGGHSCVVRLLTEEDTVGSTLDQPINAPQAVQEEAA